MKNSTLLVCSLCLAVVAAATAASIKVTSTQLDFNTPRFSRLLKQDLTQVATYLLPNREPQLCSGGNCCQADSYASPYGLKYLNLTKDVQGGRTYTTFFYKLNSAHRCNTALDDAGCCTANVSSFWVDVDPAVKVKHVTFNDDSRFFTAQQSEFGLQVSGINRGLTQITADGIPFTVTVEGDVSQLCPPPLLAPISGLCEVVVEGGSASRADACCPVSISQMSSTTFIPPNQAFQCVSDLSRSAFKMVFDGVGAPYVAVDGNSYAQYSFRLLASPECNSDLVGNCCDAQLQYLELRITDLPITKVQLNGQDVVSSTSTWNEPNSASYRSLIVDDLSLSADDMGTIGLPLTLIVKLAAGATVAPDLCDASADPAQGTCNYYLHSEDGFCCPSGLATASAGAPPPPAGTCSPTHNVKMSDTSVSLQYYERNLQPTATTFTFLMADHNDGSCTKQYCVDICSWTLYIQPELASTIAVGHENAADNGRHLVATGSPASVTFTYGPSGATTSNFYLTLPTGYQTLANLCARNAIPTQGTRDCGAILRSGNVYMWVAFSESDIVITPMAAPPPPALQLPSLCPNALSLDQSCMRVETSRYNTDSKSTTFDFALAVSGKTCTAPSPAGESFTFRVVLNPTIVDQISTQRQILPRNDVTLDRINGVAWTLGQSAVHTGFNVQGALGLADVCRQGIVPEQPPNTCLAEIQGSSKCFRGFLAATLDGRLVWTEIEESSSRGVGASTIAPAVILPVLALIAVLIAAGVFYRKRRAAAYRASNSQDGELERPLAEGSVAGSGADDNLSVQSAAPSDVHIRVPGASEGGVAASS